MSRMEDVRDEELRVNNSPSQPKGISDEEFIKKSMQAMNQMKPLNEQRNIDDLVGTASDSANYWEIKGIPSKGRLYPTGTMIKGRPLKVIEVKKLSSLNDSNSNFIINDILKRTIRGIPVEKLFVADKFFIIFWLRANTYRDSGYVVKFPCSKCEKESDFHFELNNLEVKYLNDNYNPEDVITLLSGERIRLRFLTVADETTIDRFKEINGNVIGEIDDELLSIATMIDVEGKQLTLTEKYWYVLNLDPGDFSYIVSYIDKFGMGIQPNMKVNCNSCGGSAQVGVSFRPEFFFPTYKIG